MINTEIDYTPQLNKIVTLLEQILDQLRPVDPKTGECWDRLGAIITYLDQIDTNGR